MMAPARGDGWSFARRTWPVGLVALAALAIWLPDPSSGYWQVLPPMLATIVVVAFLARGLFLRSGALPFDDLGFLHVGIASLYVLLPLGIFIAVGLEYTPLSDARLFSAAPSPDLVGRIGWFHVGYLTMVSAVYLLVVGRGRVAGRDERAPAVPFDIALAGAVIWAATELFFVGLGFFYRLAPSSYFDSYVLVQNLPLFARQIYRLATGIGLVARLVVLLWIFGDFRRRRGLLALWLVVAVLVAFVGGGSRTSLMILLTGSMFLYHRFVRPLSLRLAATLGTVMVVAFTALGVARQIRGAQQDPSSIGVGSGEFDAVFANALDMSQRRAGREFDIAIGRLYLSELFAPVPSQLLPFTKIDLSDWYLGSFYPGVRERGEGYAFGVVAQSFAGFGLPELLVRGAIIGWLFGLFTRWYRRSGHTLGVGIAYLWFAVMSYQAFRNTTFSLVSTFLQQFLPAALLIWIVSGSIVAGARAPSRASE